jgi:uncharacterized protein (UPF0332 family)
MKEKLTEDDRRALIEYRLEMAAEALQNAADSLEKEHLHGAVNRIYYACFYAVSALLTSGGYEFGSHHGAKTLFGQHYIATGKLSRKQGTFYGQIFNARNEGDYEAFVYYTNEIVGEYLAQAREFILAVRQWIDL